MVEIQDDESESAKLRDPKPPGNGSPRSGKGRPRSEEAGRAILDAARHLLIEEGYAGFRLEHVAARAKVAKATLYRRWPSKEALALGLMMELVAPHLTIADTGDTRQELIASMMNPITALTRTPFGPVVRALLSQISTNPALGDPFRAAVVQARRDEVSRVLQRGIARGDLRADADLSVATELLVGPVYFRLVFGGKLDRAFAVRVIDTLLQGYGRRD